MPCPPCRGEEEKTTVRRVPQPPKARAGGSKFSNSNNNPHNKYPGNPHRGVARRETETLAKSAGHSRCKSHPASGLPRDTPYAHKVPCRSENKSLRLNSGGSRRMLLAPGHHTHPRTNRHPVAVGSITLVSGKRTPALPTNAFLIDQSEKMFQGVHWLMPTGA